MIEVGNNIIMPEASGFGFCEGVVAADDLLKDVTSCAQALGLGAVYGYHDIVHNESVKQEHKERGVIFVQDAGDIPPDSVVVGSAHASSPAAKHSVVSTGGLFYDGGCPLVLKTHNAVSRARERREKVLFLLSGKPNEVAKIHDEISGTVGHIDQYIDRSGNLINDPLSRAYIELMDDPSNVESILSEYARYTIIGQTTLLASEVIEFRKQMAAAILAAQPHATISRIDRRDVCFAVENRQEAVRVSLSRKPDNFVVVTDPNSKNGMGYVQLAKSTVAEAGLDTQVIAVSSAENITALGGLTAVTASASTPDYDTAAVVEALGGNPMLVAVDRESFKLRGASPVQIEVAMHAWVQGKK